MPKPIKTNIVEGPRGFKMSEAIARAVEAAQKTAPKGKEFEFRRVAKSADDFQLDAGSRTDVSVITTDDVDRDRDVVIPSGIDTTQYNGVVTWAHQYDSIPMGRCLWIKAKDNGLIAKTQYAAKPKEWSSDWFPDAVLSLMQQGTCTGKSIGFIPLSYREPTVEEIKSRPELGQRYVGIIDKCTLLEYAVAPVPANQNAEMIAVSKCVPEALRDFYASAAKSIAAIWKGAKPEQAAEDIAAKAEENKVTAFVSPKTIQSAVGRAATELLGKRVREKFADRLAQAMGRP